MNRGWERRSGTSRAAVRSRLVIILEDEVLRRNAGVGIVESIEKMRDHEPLNCQSDMRVGEKIGDVKH